MAKQPLFEFGLGKALLRAFLGDFEVKVNRQAKLVTILARGQEYTYTFDQLVDELEKMLNDGQTEKQD